jgi:hypothetical protein
VVEGSVDDAETVRSRRAGVSADVQQALALDELHASRRREAGLSLPAARVSHKGGVPSGGFKTMAAWPRTSSGVVGIRRS